MSRDVLSFAPELAAWTRNFDDFTAIFQRMSNRLKDLDQKLQDTTAELDHEIETRKNWMKRANEFENRAKQQQFILVLLDGNQSCFKDDVIKASAGSAESAAKSLVAEVLETAKSRHKNDLASDIQVLIHVFLDMDRLARDLVSAGSLSNRQQLDEFFKALTACTPLLSVMDCGHARQSVDAKVKDHYELFIENVQCRHIILALGHDSEYYATLDMYSEDAYTLGKTSLVKTVHGFPSKYNLPFHQVEFTSLDTVPLISFNADHSEAAPVVGSTSSRELDTVDPAEPSGQARSTKGSGSSQHSEQAHISGSGSHSRSAGSGSRSLQHTSPPSSKSSGKAPEHTEQPSAFQKPSEPSLPPLAVGYPPQPSTYEATIASYERDWERSSGQNTLSPPPATTPWGQEQDVSENIIDPFNPPQDDERRLHRKSYATAHQQRAPQQPRQKERITPRAFINSNRIDSARRGPTSFQGSWDDLVSRKIESSPDVTPPIQSPPVRSPALVPLPGVPVQCDIAINRVGERIDQSLPPISENDKSRLKARTRDHKLCNEHHLRRACHNGQCCYDHEPIDAGILLALRHLARTQACDIGPACRMSECAYGHRCPYRDGGKECSNSKCSFKKKGMHHIRDLKVVEVLPASRT